MGVPEHFVGHAKTRTRTEFSLHRAKRSNGLTIRPVSYLSRFSESGVAAVDCLVFLGESWTRNAISGWSREEAWLPERAQRRPIAAGVGQSLGLTASALQNG